MEYYSVLKRNNKPWKNMEETEMHITELKKPIWKGFIVYNSSYITF